MENQKQAQSGQLKRTLKGRHLTMIAIGGSIGTGLFLATGYTVNRGGPGGTILAYSIVAVMVYFLIMSLGEMATWLPCSGSFQTYCSKFISPAYGFAVGWNYWFNWAVVIGIEIVASALVMKYWFPGVPAWIWSLLFIAIILSINLLSARAYGETEYWFASIKVTAVIAFLITGVGMMTGAIGGHAVGFTNFTQSVGGPFPNGILAVFAVTFTAVFCFLGTELVGIAAGEGENPEETIPKAIKTVFIRIVLFYLGATFIVAALVPWQEGSVAISPFVMIFEKAGIPFAAGVMNFVVLTSTLSCANSGLYASSRMVFAMAKEGKAPKIFARVSKQGVPVPALLLTSLMGGGAFLSRFMSPDKVYLILVSASGLATLFSWLGIAISHYKFRKWFVAQGHKISELKFKAPFYPIGPWVAGILCIVVIIAQFFDPTARLTAWTGVPLFLLVWGYGKYKQNKGELTVPDEMELRAQSCEVPSKSHIRDNLVPDFIHPPVADEKL